MRTFLNFALSVFLYDLITNKARKLEVAEANLMENIASSLSPSLSLSLCQLGFLSFFLFHVLSLAHSISLSLSLLNSCVDAAH